MILKTSFKAKDKFENDLIRKQRSITRIKKHLMNGFKLLEQKNESNEKKI